MTIEFSFFGDPNPPPYITDGLPTGSTERRTVEVSFSVRDNGGHPADEDTLDVDFILDPDGSPETFNAIINGVFQTGYDGTITPNAYNGFDVVIDTHPPFAEAEWKVDVYVEDEGGEPGTGDWKFTTLWLPELLEARPIARRVIELIFDIPIRVRKTDILIEEPENRYTPVNWQAKGGLTQDAANPANYIFSRPSSGNLVEPGEAVELTPTYAQEADGYWEDNTAVPPVRSATRIWVTTSFQMTARASYEVLVQNVTWGSNVINPLYDEASFAGYAPSKVERGSLRLWDIVGRKIRSDDVGSDTLLRFFTALQEVLDRSLEDIDAFFQDLCSIDKMRAEFLDMLLYDLGNPFAEIFELDTLQKRKLANVLVEMYRQKGTCVGIRNVVRFFLGVELEPPYCIEPWSGVWSLGKGTYPSPVGGSKLGTETKLGPALKDVFGFRLKHANPASLSQDTKDKIEVIANYMKPAHTHYVGITT